MYGHMSVNARQCETLDQEVGIETLVLTNVLTYCHYDLHSHSEKFHVTPPPYIQNDKG